MVASTVLRLLCLCPKGNAILGSEQRLFQDLEMMKPVASRMLGLMMEIEFIPLWQSHQDPLIWCTVVTIYTLHWCSVCVVFWDLGLLEVDQMPLFLLIGPCVRFSMPVTPMRPVGLWRGLECWLSLMQSRGVIRPDWVFCWLCDWKAWALQSSASVAQVCREDLAGSICILLAVWSVTVIPDD